MMSSLRILIVALCAAWTTAARGSTAVLDAGTGLIGCQGDVRVTPWAPKVSVVSKKGGLHFTLVEASPAPPARGDNHWTLRVTDASGAVKPHLALSVEPFMPDHGHGTGVKARVSAQPDGTYAVGPLNLFMPGVWRVTVFVSMNAGRPDDEAVFFFCIAG
jgi:hypothetical protein